MYSVELSPAAARDIRKLPRQQQAAIVARLDDLASDPRPAGSKKLKGHDLHRIRLGDYRIVYTIEDARLRVLVIRVGHRSDVYKRL